MDLVKEIRKQFLDSIAIVQQADDILWQWISFQLYSTTYHITMLHHRQIDRIRYGQPFSWLQQ